MVCVYVCVCCSLGRLLFLSMPVILLYSSNSLYFWLLIAGATCPGNDLSLFYGDITALTTITDRRKFLSADMYGALVRDAVVCCVDIVLVRYNRQLQRKECLLVERSTEPVKGVWWWPGGRLLKGKSVTRVVSEQELRFFPLTHFFFSFQERHSLPLPSARRSKRLGLQM
jgi:hypothetical protein